MKQNKLNIKFYALRGKAYTARIHRILWHSLLRNKIPDGCQESEHKILEVWRTSS
jgi:hypothetical protein